MGPSWVGSLIEPQRTLLYDPFASSVASLAHSFPRDLLILSLPNFQMESEIL